MDLQGTSPIEFIGTAQSEGEPVIICLSSDEDDHMDCISSGSMDDLVCSSDEEKEEIQLMAICVERQMPDPIPIPALLDPLSRKRGAQHRGQTDHRSLPFFSQKYFNLGKRERPISLRQPGEKQSHH